MQVWTLIENEWSIHDQNSGSRFYTRKDQTRNTWSNEGLKIYNLNKTPITKPLIESCNSLLMTYRFTLLSDDNVLDTDIGAATVLCHRPREGGIFVYRPIAVWRGKGRQQVDLSALKQVYAFTDCRSIGWGLVWLDGAHSFDKMFIQFTVMACPML